MSEAVIDAAVSEFKSLSVDEIVLSDLVREVHEEGVQRILDSLSVTGEILQPLLVDSHNVLIDGAHRLEAAKRLGYATVEVKVVPSVRTLEQRSLVAVLANTARQQMTLPEVTRIYKPLRDWIAQDRARAQQAHLLQGQEPRGANFAQREDLVPDIADDGKTRSTIRNMLGFSEDAILKFQQLKGWSVSVEVPEAVRGAAERSLKVLESKPGALSSEFQKVARLVQQVEAGPVRVAAASEASEKAAVMKKIYGFWEWLQSSPAIGASLSSQDVEALQNFGLAVQAFVQRVQHDFQGGAS